MNDVRPRSFAGVSGHDSGRRHWPGWLAALLAIGSLAIALGWLVDISRHDPWYRNTDMNMHNMVDSLAINSSAVPNRVDQPGLVSKYLLALDERIRHEFGILPVWNMRRFGSIAEPLHAIPPLVRAGRAHQKLLVALFILSAAGMVYAVTRKALAACLAVILLSGSSALLFHGLLMRPELHCAWFGSVLALFCVWRATEADGWSEQHLWLFLCGLMVGLAALSKLPGICYFGLCYVWCWFAAVLRTLRRQPESRPSVATEYRRGILPAVASLLLLGLLMLLARVESTLGEVAVLRLRMAAGTLGFLPLLLIRDCDRPFLRFLQERCRELLLLAAGLCTALPLSYLALRAVMTETAASEYMARVLAFVIDPGPTMRSLVDTTDSTPALGQYLRRDLVLFIAVSVAGLGLLRLRPADVKPNAFLFLLLAGASGMILVMSKRHFTPYYGIFFQVPLLLASAIAAQGLLDWLQARLAARSVARWLGLLAAGMATLLLLGGLPRVRSLYENYQSDAALPVNDLTLTFIFDHDAHAAAYLKIMRDRYGSRAQFRTVLDEYLADPANRR